MNPRLCKLEVIIDNILIDILSDLSIMDNNNQTLNNKKLVILRHLQLSRLDVICKIYIELLKNN